jgi:hypothetical protein
MATRVAEPVTVQTVEADGVTGQYRQVVVLIPEAEAEALASGPRTAGGDLYADQAREVAEPIAAALVAAGLGS